MFLLGLIFLLAGCERPDDFMYATKLVYAPDTIVVNEPFTMKVVIRNDSLKDMKFTIDKKVYQSVHFFPSLKCGGEYIGWDTNEWRDESREFEVVHLGKGDSLAYDLKFCLKSEGDSLVFQVEDYYKITSFAKSACKSLTIDIAGDWRPGNSPFLDPGEGYGFGLKSITVVEKDKTIN
jgi:hypothetical protein